QYPVFMTMTKGESTGSCKGAQPRLDLGPWGSFDRSVPAGCKGARTASLNDWLDDQSDADRYLNDYVRAEKSELGYNMVKYVDTAPTGGKDPGKPDSQE